MKNRLRSLVLMTVILFVGGLLLFPTAAEAAEMGEVDTQTSLNVRSGPSEEAEIIGSLLPGERIEYIDLGNGWGQVTYREQLGFVSTAYLSAGANERKPQKEETSDHSETEQEKEESEERSEKVNQIVLDPGHGGKDSGAIGHSLKEKDVALDISKRVETMLTDKGYEVLLTRSDDVFMSLEERAERANRWEGDLFVSIHANGFSDASAKGIETFYSVGSREGERLASRIQNQLISETANVNRGVFEADFVVLRNTLMPAVLVETGFVSNESDATLLKSDEYREQVATAITAGILDD
ncbi:N-acetylmuramoyl-L-alanine amidase [Shouchella shacheensis]|uniref:N-acetylmuramoyl-L-alanine amidase n=1 Tax=Shouchella shacheensis TaxID=1649580 RepID=UPI0007402BF0|nr:N-acetylmuramoyl-L-alanine amidase [Shouchella shacheensis]